MAENKWKSKEEYERWKAGDRKQPEKTNDRIVSDDYNRQQSVQCPNCKYEGPGKYFENGSGCIEVLLWLMGILPGFLYHIHRSNNSYYGCPRCDFRYVVKIGSGRQKASSIPKMLMVALGLIVGFSILISMCSHK